jgi:hypothetical protein
MARRSAIRSSGSPEPRVETVDDEAYREWLCAGPSSRSLAGRASEPRYTRAARQLEEALSEEGRAGVRPWRPAAPGGALPPLG